MVKYSVRLAAFSIAASSIHLLHPVLSGGVFTHSTYVVVSQTGRQISTCASILELAVWDGIKKVVALRE